MRKIDLNKEKIYENSKQFSPDVRSAQSKFYWANEPNIFLHDNLTFELINNKDVLEIGCSSGTNAAIYIKSCVSYTGIDISDEAINIANSKFKQNEVTFFCSDAHILSFRANTFDCVIVNSLLHHMDLAVVLKEIHRVLKTDGLLIFREPLGTNVLFNLYRFLTPSARTVDEMPLNFSDLKIIDKHFIPVRVEYFGFLSILSAFFKSHRLRSILINMDLLLSKTPIKFFFWQISGVLRKKNNF